jgi:hypothetical protein
VQMAPPSDHHHKLKTLAGKWVGEETIHPTPWDPKGGAAWTVFGVASRFIRGACATGGMSTRHRLRA